MNGALYSLLERVHGLAAALGLAVLLHPVITLRARRKPSRGAVLSADLGALLLLLPSGLGAWLYPVYRARVKPDLVEEAPRIAALFETKEHLALMAVALAVSGALSLRAAGRTEEGRRTARTLLALAWATGVATAALGTVVASIAQPGW